MVKSIDDGTTNPASITGPRRRCTERLRLGQGSLCPQLADMYDLANFDPERSQINGQVKMTTVPVFAASLANGVKSASVDGSSGFSVVGELAQRRCGLGVCEIPDQRTDSDEVFGAPTADLDRPATRATIWRNWQASVNRPRSRCRCSKSSSVRRISALVYRTTRKAPRRSSLRSRLR